MLDEYIDKQTDLKDGASELLVINKSDLTPECVVTSDGVTESLKTISQCHSDIDTVLSNVKQELVDPMDIDDIPVLEKLYNLYGRKYQCSAPIDTTFQQSIPSSGVKETTNKFNMITHNQAGTDRSSVVQKPECENGVQEDFSGVLLESAAKSADTEITTSQISAEYIQRHLFKEKFRFICNLCNMLFTSKFVASQHICWYFHYYVTDALFTLYFYIVNRKDPVGLVEILLDS